MSERDIAAPPTADATPWHAATAADAMRRAGSPADGLSEGEAEARLARHGPNRLPEPKRRGPLRRLVRQVHNLLIYVLIAAAALSALIGHHADAAVILAVVVANTVIGAIQEGRAERALEAIRTMIDQQASVMRCGRRATVPADRIVPGDLVLLEAGDRVPADLRLVRARNLRIEEAVLTGESVAVDKQVEPVAADRALGDRASMAFSGTFVAAGQGAGVAVATGPGTELGKISGMIQAVKPLQTPLLAQMERLARQLTLIVLGVAGAAFAAAVLLRGYGLAEGFMLLVGLAVAAIPEGLPAVMTITMAIGVQRMASRNAIIRRLPAVETLGSVSVICSDKTGTFTRNEMTARTLFGEAGEQPVSGVGYAPEGRIGGGEPDRDLLRAALLCNDAQLREADDGWRVDGDPMEGALLSLAMKAGLSPDEVRRERPRIDEIPFDARYRFMATLHRDETPLIFVKGAPEPVLDLCACERAGTGERPLDRDRWLEAAERIAARGERVLGFAMKRPDAVGDRLDFDDLAGATFLGLVGFIDPPREEAIEAVRRCRSAGIRVVMITGDHAVTATAIARQLELAEDPRTMTGQALDGLDEAALRQAVAETTVFARTAPEHKLRLVEALQADGAIVAMTGDGVNDAPALKRADVGIAMGRKGTEASKEAAQMVLADDNFASIAAAVVEGRTVYDNLRKVIGWTLPTNGGEALTLLTALALGATLPVTPIQILWINMVTAVALGLTLAFEPAEPDIMRRPPRRRGEHLLSPELLWRVGFVSLIMAAGAFGTYAWGTARDLPIEATRTLVVNAIVVMEIFYLFSVRYIHGPSMTLRGVIGTPAVLIGVGLVVAAQFAFTYWPALNRVFQSMAVGIADGAFVVAIGIGLLLLVEAEKALRRRLAARAPDAGRRKQAIA